MTATPLIDVAKRLLTNVDANHSDESTDVLRLPGTYFTDQARHVRELEQIFRRSPLLVALSCDLVKTGDFVANTIAGRPYLVVRGDDGIARAFLNICRHRGAKLTDECFGSSRRFTCPYHAWVYNTTGELTWNTAEAAFAGIDVKGLIELPTAERSGAVFAILTPGLPLEIDEWLGDMASALQLIQLDKLHRHRDALTTASGNWKATADGYVDGYHLGFLHKNSIGAKSITDRNTYDLFGPHVRVGFANKPILTMRETAENDWNLREAMSLVHFIFPNISISGLPGHGLMMSRILPGPDPTRCEVEQYQYFREPMTAPEQIADADAKRELYFAVTRDEDFATVLQVTDAAGALGPDTFHYGRNEAGNQNVHRWIAKLSDNATPEALP